MLTAKMQALNFEKFKMKRNPYSVESRLTKVNGLWYHISVFRTRAVLDDGEMSEWLKEPVLKTGDAQVSVGSNPTLSANQMVQPWNRCRSTQVAEGAPLLRE